jgi:phage terminase small subunit
MNEALPRTFTNLKGAIMTVVNITKPVEPHAPSHLRPETAAWYLSVVTEWELQDHHERLVLIAAEAWDRALQAREALDEHGLTFNDRFGAPHARPEVKVERDARIAFMRTLREVDLDLAPPAAPSGRRPPSLRSNRTGG